MGRDDREPSRQELVAAAPEEGRAPGRKDRRHWCRGKVGRRHRWEFTIPPNIGSWQPGCRPAPDWWLRTRAFQLKPEPWWCSHRWVCAECGKQVDKRRNDVCPDRPDSLAPVAKS
jgi:hypothetical protein